jgi:hypothetical protein
MSTRQLEAAYGTIHRERVKSTAEPQWPYLDQIRIIQASDEVSCCGSNFQLHVSVIFLSLLVLQNIYHMKSAGHLYWQLSPQWDSR